MNNRFISLICIALFLGACATGGSRTLSGLEVTDVLATFKNGELRLECDTSCSGAWGFSRRTAKSYYDNQLWTDLVMEVGKVGFRVDQAYFYLGRSAEGLGYFDAARTYYNLAQANRHKCAGTINNCDGIDVPKETREGLGRLPKTPSVGINTSGITETPSAPVSESAQPKAIPATAQPPKAQPLKVEPPKAEPPMVEPPKSDSYVSSLVGTVKVEYDEFKKLTKYQGPDVGSKGDYLFLRAWKQENGRLVIQIYLADYYDGEWRFYDSAYDSEGNKLEFTSIFRDVKSCSRYGWCSHTEHVGITVTKSYLEARRNSGIKFKVSGKAGEKIFFFPAEHIGAFLDALKR